MTQPTLDGMPEPPARPPARPAPDVRWSVLRLARNPVCSTCVTISLHENTWRRVRVAAYRRRTPDDETFLCPQHAEEQRRLDGRAHLPRRTT